MLKDFLVEFTEKYHELGHEKFLCFDSIENSDTVNSMIDSVAGLGHRIKFGHDFNGLSKAFEIDGIEGITSWFDHMLKDFTSHDGLPLPGAEIFQKLTGMDFSSAVEWLSINAADVIEVGLTGGALQLIDNKYKTNSKLKSVVKVLAATVGIVDDNPLLLGYITIKVANDLNHKFKILKNDSKAGMSALIHRSAKNVKNIGITTLVLGTTTQVMFGKSASESGEIVIASLLDGFGDLTGMNSFDGSLLDMELVEIFGDLIDSFATLGLGIVIGKGIKYLFDFFNAPLIAKIKFLSESNATRNLIRKKLTSELSPIGLKSLLKFNPNLGYYRKLLLEKVELT